MRNKMKGIKDRLKNMRKAVSAGLMAFTAFLWNAVPASAAGVQDSGIVKGTQKLMLIIYFCIRRSAADEVDQKKWNNRIVVAVVSCIGAVLGSATLNLILGYYS